MIGALIVLAAFLAAFIGSETLIPKFPRLDAWLDRFMGGECEVTTYDAREFSERHPL